MQKLDNKKIKDPIYGYVSIPGNYVSDIIDTPSFQRLRRVIQTSYTPLYSSALHNRFVHSIGVLNLGRIVAERLKLVIMNKKILEKTKIEKYANTYEIACLLHDVGHAPFSHTGEIYYQDDNFTSKKLHERLRKLVPSSELKKDIPIEAESAAPHELMSAIVGIDKYSKLLADDDCKELFVRCITGYKYKNHTEENEIKNCFISMLNSKVIDVDRLDYLIRDAYTSGFATISIDYLRLLNALTIVRDEKGSFVLAYLKDAVSVIENVVYAHDAERKWIQNHPVVLYEAYIIKDMLENLNTKLNSSRKRLFSEQALSETGIELKNKIKLKLMCDDDVVYLSKNLYGDELSREFFDRNKRRHPVWKSESEYKAYIDHISTGGQYSEEFTECMQAFNESKVPDHPIPMIINDGLIEKFEKELKHVQGEHPTEYRNIDAIKRKLSACRFLQQYAKRNNFPFDYIVIQTSMFTSNFSKKHLKEVKVAFGKNEENIRRLEEVCNILKSDSADKDFYYLFYRKERADKSSDAGGDISDIKEFCRKLYDSVTTANQS